MFHGKTRYKENNKNPKPKPLSNNCHVSTSLVLLNRKKKATPKDVVVSDSHPFWIEIHHGVSKPGIHVLIFVTVNYHLS